MSWGALLFGHADPAIVRAVRDAAGRGTSFGAATEAEVRLAEEVKKRFRSIDLLRFVSSGTEATMSAVRVARTADIVASDRKSTRLNSSHSQISYAVFCLKKKK